MTLRDLQYLLALSRHRHPLPMPAMSAADPVHADPQAGGIARRGTGRTAPAPGADDAGRRLVRTRPRSCTGRTDPPDGRNRTRAGSLRWACSPPWALPATARGAQGAAALSAAELLLVEEKSEKLAQLLLDGPRCGHPALPLNSRNCTRNSVRVLPPGRPLPDTAGGRRRHPAAQRPRGRKPVVAGGWPLPARAGPLGLPSGRRR